MGNEIASGFTCRESAFYVRESVTYKNATFERVEHERGGENPSISIGSRRADPRVRYSAHTFCVPTLVPSDEWQSQRRPDTVHRREVSPERLDLWPARTHLRGESDPPDAGLGTGNREIGMRFTGAVASDRNARRPPRNSRQDWRFSW